MPTYDYECPQGHRHEVFQKMSDDPVSKCPECGEPAQRKISGGAGFLFKGEGFYITDYRSDEYKKKASAEAPGADTKASTKGDAKPSAGGSGTSAGDSGTGGTSSGSKSSGGASSDS